MRFRIAVCDNDKIFVTQLKKSIEEIIEQKRIDCEVEIFLSGQALIEEIEKGNTFHGIFMDVQLNDENGLNISIEIKKYLENVSIILMSAFVNHAVYGYRMGACRFLLKGSNEFNDDLEDAIAYISQIYLSDIRWEIFAFVEGKERVRLNKISYIESHGHLLHFYIWKNDELVKRILRDRLDMIEDRISSVNYCRIHKSYLINMKYIKMIDGNVVILKHGKSMKISQSRMKNVCKEYTVYLERA